MSMLFQAVPRPDVPKPPQPRASIPVDAQGVVDASWRGWIADNLLRGVPPANLQRDLERAGLANALAAHNVQLIQSEASFSTARKFQDLLEKSQSTLLNLAHVVQQQPNYTEIERRSGLTREAFIREYYLQNRPVILTDFAHDCLARTRWTLEYFRERFAGTEIEVQEGRDTEQKYELHKTKLKTQMRVATFIDKIKANSGNDLYLTANNRASAATPLGEAIVEDINPVPDLLDAAGLREASNLWIGARGTITPLHHDTSSLVHWQVRGSKRWRMISPLETPYMYNFMGVFSAVDAANPNLARHPLFAKATVIDVVVQEGETLFVPVGWWHHVESLDASISISFTNLADVNNLHTYHQPGVWEWM